MRDCLSCKGLGTLPADTYSPERTCYACDGAKQYPLPDYSTIRDLVINPKTGKLWSTSFHSKAGRKRTQDLPDVVRRRAQYVWRMAQWNAGIGGSNLGGAVMAGMDLGGGDPYRNELDGLADMVADKCYGKGANMVSALRWQRAMHGE